MNIRAVMAVLDEWTLPRTEKDALLRVACRADRHTWAAEVSAARIAADMSVHYNTAAKALQNLAFWGYLQPVDKSPGRTTQWRIDPHSLSVGVPPQSTGPTPTTDNTNPHSLTRDVGVEGEKRRSAERHDTVSAVSPDAGEKLKALRRAMTPAEWMAGIADCPYCDECGYRQRTDGVIRCSHRLHMPDELTVDDVLGSVQQ